jgi:hypothetical protein
MNETVRSKESKTMRVRQWISRASFTFWVVGFLFLGAHESHAHCDGLDGPVVTAARHALETKDVNHVLIWVQKEDEGEIRRAFEHTLAVRELNNEAKELADRYFFETLVRVHRAGEGAPYTGLKPAGRDLGPALPAADRAIESGSLESLKELLTQTMHQGLEHTFERAMARKSFDIADLSAGREFVNAYVTFIHHVERVYETAKSESHDRLRPEEGPRPHQNP